MLVAIIVLSILLILSLTIIVMIGVEDSWNFDAWFSILIFIFCLPLWVVLKILTSIIVKKKK